MRREFKCKKNSDTLIVIRPIDLSAIIFRKGLSAKDNPFRLYDGIYISDTEKLKNGVLCTYLCPYTVFGHRGSGTSVIDRHRDFPHIAGLNLGS